MGLAKVHCGATPPSVMVLLQIEIQTHSDAKGVRYGRYICIYSGPSSVQELLTELIIPSQMEV